MNRPPIPSRIKGLRTVHVQKHEKLRVSGSDSTGATGVIEEFGRVDMFGVYDGKSNRRPCDDGGQPGIFDESRRHHTCCVVFREP